MTNTNSEYIKFDPDEPDDTFGQEKSYNVLFGWVEVVAISDDEAIKKAAQLIATGPTLFFRELEIEEEEETSDF